MSLGGGGGGSQPQKDPVLEAQSAQAAELQGVINDKLNPLTRRGVGELRNRDLSGRIAGRANADAHQASAEAQKAAVKLALAEGGSPGTGLARGLGENAIDAGSIKAKANMAGTAGNQKNQDEAKLNYVREGFGVARSTTSALNELSSQKTSEITTGLRAKATRDAAKRQALAEVAGAAIGGASKRYGLAQDNKLIAEAKQKRAQEYGRDYDGADPNKINFFDTDGNGSWF